LIDGFGSTINPAYPQIDLAVFDFIFHLNSSTMADEASNQSIIQSLRQNDDYNNDPLLL